MHVIHHMRAFATSGRAHTLSRFANRPTGPSRKGFVPLRREVDFTHSKQSQNIPYDEVSKLWHTSRRPPSSDKGEGLRTLLMHHKAQIEMLNIFVGFEQCNKYTINNEAGETVGYIAEESRNFLSIMSRQAFATHRPFRAIIMDAGSPVLWLRRPFAWINSRMYLQRLQDLNSYTNAGEPILDTFGEVQQVWHPWRRRYDAFLREGLSLAHETQLDPDPELTYTQFAKVDAGPLAWHFPLYDKSGREIAFIRREFRGFGREIFTDTGQYLVSFVTEGPYSEVGSAAKLTIDQRTVILAFAVNIDFDYFSRHSHVGSGVSFHAGSWEE